MVQDGTYWYMLVHDFRGKRGLSSPNMCYVRDQHAGNDSESFTDKRGILFGYAFVRDLFGSASMPLRDLFDSASIRLRAGFDFATTHLRYRFDTCSTAVEHGWAMGGRWVEEHLCDFQVPAGLCHEFIGEQIITVVMLDGSFMMDNNRI